MKLRRAPGFTITELLIIVVVIAILAAITLVAYNGITKTAEESAIKAGLREVATEMRLGLLETKSYPTTLSTKLAANTTTELEVKSSGSETRYSNLTPVQNGVLFSVACQNLIDNGVGKGQDQGGDVQDYVTGCGNWNYNKVQIGGWANNIIDTPVTVQQLRTYGDTFTTNTAYHKATHEATVKKFYNTLADTFTRQGGTVPITSFWDYWADAESGGVYYEPLPAGQAYKYYCAEAQSKKLSDIIWHVTETNAIVAGPC